MRRIIQTDLPKAWASTLHRLLPFITRPIEDTISERTNSSQDPPRSSLCKELHEYFPATWLALLTHLGVDRPEIWKIRAIGADYIPSELPAAPAYGSIKDVTNLALIASSGPCRIDKDPKSPLLSMRSIGGSGFGLTFRDHALLGIVGSFETFVNYRTQEGPREQSADDEDVRPKTEYLSEAIGFAHGWVRGGALGNDAVFRPTFNWIVSEYDIDDSSAQLHSLGGLFMIFNDLRAGCSHPELSIIPGGSPATSDGEEPDNEATLESLGKVGESVDGEEEDDKRDDGNVEPPIDTQQSFRIPTPLPPLPPVGELKHELEDLVTQWKFAVRYAALASAAAPSSPPPVFPHSRAQLFEILEPFLLQSGMWSEGSMCHGIKFQRRRGITRGAIRIDDMDGLAVQAATQVTSKRRPELSMTVYEASRKFLTLISAKPKDRGSTTLGAIQNLRISPKERRHGLLKEIQQIDSWVISERPKGWNCRVLVLTRIAIMADVMARAHKILHHNHNNSSHSEVAPGISSNPDGLQPDSRDHVGNEWQLFTRRLLIHWKIEQNRHREDILKVLARLERLWQPGQSRETFECPDSTHPLDDLVIYRIILMVMLLSSAVDNSILMEDEFYERVVPIL